MEEKKFQFLGLLFFGLLVLATSLFLSGTKIPITSSAVVRLKSGTAFSLSLGIFALVILAFYIRIRTWIKTP